MKRFFAFTLAETLVVIGIIGIISALTLPNLNSSTGEKEKVVSLQKTYSELIEAISRAEIVYGPVGTWHLAGNSDNTNSIVVERIREFLKVSKFCGTTNPDNCFVYKIQQNNTMPTFILASGASILFSGVSNNCQKLNTTDGFNYCGPFLIDVDGPNKGKNVQIYYEDKKIKNKFKYADKLQIPYTIVIGEDEEKLNTYTIKNMITGEQTQEEV